jgi:hypothetical protein
MVMVRRVIKAGLGLTSWGRLGLVRVKSSGRFRVRVRVMVRGLGLVLRLG